MALPRPLRLRLRLGAIAAVVVGAGIGLSACGDDDGTVNQATTTVPAAVSTTPGAVTTTSVSAATTTVAAGRTVEYVFRDGKVQSGESRVTVRLGEPVTVRVVSDVAEEVHVHTYDLTADLAPGVAGEISFVADIPGVHEVELEGSHLHLFSLEVQ